MTHSAPDKKSDETTKSPKEEHSTTRNNTNPNTTTNTDWDKWAEREEEWRRAGGDKEPDDEGDDS